MKNVTITLDKETAAWARVHAAQRNMSLSRFVGELLQQRMHESREYEEAMQRFLSKRLSSSSRDRRSVTPSARRCMTGPCFVDANVLVLP
jgi:hypothetical protein